MLLIPDKRIRKTKLFLGITAISCSIVLFIFIVPLPNTLGPTSSNSPPEQFSFEIADSYVRLLQPIKPVMNEVAGLIILISIFLLLQIGFFWTPSFKFIFSPSYDMKIHWKRSKIILPERLCVIKLNKGIITIKRKKSTISGLFLNEYNVETRLPKILDPPPNNFIDFLSFDKLIETPKEFILTKTVQYKCIPLHIFKIEALLGN
ncbi:hypothetical protein [Candidatus Hodarchaeum mangrovi]